MNSKKAGGKKVFDKNKVALVLDHFTPNKDINSAQQCKAVREFAMEQKITHFYEGGQVGVEHACFRKKALSCPAIWSSARTATPALTARWAHLPPAWAARIWPRPCLPERLWFKVPQSIKFVIYGKLQKWVSGKDLILHIIGRIGVDGALYQAMEFTGETIGKLPMADRFSMANMAIEAGAKNGIFAPDAITKEYVKEHERNAL